jgi:hypothetical protein
VAERAFTSRPTLRRIEAGDHGVGIGIYAAVLQALGFLDGLAQLADATRDAVGLALTAERLPLGTVYRHVHRGVEAVSFEYHPVWLDDAHRFSLEPALSLNAVHTRLPPACRSSARSAFPLLRACCRSGEGDHQARGTPTNYWQSQISRICPAEIAIDPRVAPV